MVIETTIQHVLVDEVSLFPFSGFFVVTVATNAAASQQHEILVAEVADDLYFFAEILVSLDIRLDDFLHRDWAPVGEFSFVENIEASFPDHVLRGEVLCGYLQFFEVIPYRVSIWSRVRRARPCDSPDRSRRFPSPKIHSAEYGDDQNETRGRGGGRERERVGERERERGRAGERGREGGRERGRAGERGRDGGRAGERAGERGREGGREREGGRPEERGREGERRRREREGGREGGRERDGGREGESDGYYVAYKPITLSSILFMFVEMKFIHCHSYVMFAMKSMSMCND